MDKMDELKKEFKTCIPGVVAVGIGYVLYKVVPEVFAKVRELFGNYFYKTVYVTMSQNKIKFIHLLKFMNTFNLTNILK